jgi:hypothetical protein
MATFGERGYQSIRGRHMLKVRDLAESIRDNAGYVLADLARGRIPSSRALPDDVRELDRRLHILEAIGELKDIYDAGKAG